MSFWIDELNGRFLVQMQENCATKTVGDYAQKAAAEAHVAIAAKGLSFDQTRQRLQAWACEQYPAKSNDMGMGAWVQDVFPDRFIYCEPDGKTYQRSYALVAGELTVGEAAEVVQTWEEVKSAGDGLVFAGGAVKALADGKIGGYLVTFGDEGTPDQSAERDFFTAETDYGVEFPATSPVLYRHGLDASLKLRRLGRGEMKTDDVGVWIEAQLNMRDEYEQGVYAMAKAGKLGWSSGTASHLVAREPVKREGKTIAHRITAWPLGLDASLTYDPADCRNHAVALKSLSAEPSFEDLAAEEGITISEAPPAFQGTFGEEAKAVATACNGFAQRVERRTDARIKSGRMLSAANLAALTEAQDEMRAVMGRIDALLEKARPKQADSEATEAPAAKSETDRVRTDFLRLQHQHRSIAL